jgi:hypothetical protein
VKKLVLVLLSLVFLTAVFLVIVLILNKDSGRGALQVTANPKSKVYLDGDYIGDTPLCKCELPQMLPVGQYLVKLVSHSSTSASFEQKIKINPQVLTVVDRTFSKESQSSGSIITLSSIQDKDAVEVMAVSFPNNVKIFLDNNEEGSTPLILKNLTASDHEIKLTKDGFNDKIIKVRTVAGFQLEAIVFLGMKGREEKSNTATSSAAFSVGQVEILETPTGFLRVRSEASVNSEEVGRVNPGQTFNLIKELEDWYQIKLTNGTLGWISSQYATKK